MNKKLTYANESGFAIAGALAILVICAVLGVFFLKMFNLGQEDAVRNASSERAYQAAKAGSEYAAYQSLMLGNCVNSSLSLAAFTELTVALTCQRYVTSEVGVTVNIDTWAVVACNTASCPGPLSSSYVERRMRLVIAK